jgi:hypothetical protein
MCCSFVWSNSLSPFPWTTKAGGNNVQPVAQAPYASASRIPDALNLRFGKLADGHVRDFVAAGGCDSFAGVDDDLSCCTRRLTISSKPDLGRIELDLITPRVLLIREGHCHHIPLWKCRPSLRDQGSEEPVDTVISAA